MSTTLIFDHHGDTVTDREVGPIDPPSQTHQHPEHVEGCWACVLNLPWDEQVRRAAAARKRSYQCTYVGCDEPIVQGGACVRHEERAA